MASRISYGNQIVTDGLVLLLDAANPKSYISGSTTVNDLSGYRNNGTLVNGVVFSGNTFTFDGIDDYISLDDNTVFIYDNQPFSVSIWFYYSSYPNVYSDILFIKTNTGNSFQIGSTTNEPSYGSIAFGAYGNWIRKHTGTGYLALLNTWTNFTLTYNGSGSTNASNFNAYVNGVLKSQSNQSGYAVTQNINRIGYNYGNGRFSGKIPSVMYYNRALTQDEITQNYNSLKSRFGL